MSTSRRSPGTSRHHKHSVPSLNIQVLQTAASLENLAVLAYGSAARLAVIRDGDPALAAFASRTRTQHAAHAKAFNAAVVRAGGSAQPDADPRYAVPVSRALRDLADAASAVTVLESLESINAQSFTRYASLAGPELRSMFVSVATVEAAHGAYLLAMLKLLQTGEAGLTGFPRAAADLPGTLGAACFPLAFYSTAQASAIDEGAVR
jgi:Ferritin-like domain